MGQQASLLREEPAPPDAREDDGAERAPVSGAAPGPARAATTLSLETGERVVVGAASAEVYDAGGRLLLRYERGALLVSAPDGDVSFAAPNGRIVFEAGQDVAIAAERDIVQRAGRAVSLGSGDGIAASVSVERGRARIAAPRVEVRADATAAELGEATIAATHARTSATTWSLKAERVEVSATRIIEKAQDAFRDIAELAQTRVGRARTLVRDVFAVYSRRTSMASKDDTRIDGKRVLLG